jgi:hypothetical protein
MWRWRKRWRWCRGREKKGRDAETCGGARQRAVVATTEARQQQRETEGGIGADNERHKNDEANENQHQANKSKQLMQVHWNDLAKIL